MVAIKLYKSNGERGYLRSTDSNLTTKRPHLAHNFLDGAFAEDHINRLHADPIRMAGVAFAEEVHIKRAR
jgi:hypothetical protein